MNDLGSLLVLKKEANEISNKISYYSVEFAPKYHIIKCMLVKVFKINNKDKLQNHIENNLLNHRVETYNQ